MEVFEIALKVFLLKDIDKAEIQEKITSFLDGTLSEDKEMLLLHNDNKRYKLYSYGGLQPVERGGIYHAEMIYSITIRTVESTLAKFFFTFLPKYQTDYMKGLVTDIRIIRRQRLERIYTLTPLVIKNEEGYWRDCLSFEEYEQRIKINLIKKYRQFSEQNITDDFIFYTAIQTDNRKPISVNYKNIKLLGDKLTLYIADDEISQEMAYFALGAGLGEMQSRGFGFIKGCFMKNF